MGGDDFAVPVTWFTNPFYFHVRLQNCLSGMAHFLTDQLRLYLKNEVKKLKIIIHELQIMKGRQSPQFVVLNL